MIKVTVQREKNRLQEVVVKGHSGYDEQGKDIVCASVSSIVITSINAIERLHSGSITFLKEDGYLKIVVVHPTNHTNELLENMLDLLKSLEQSYPKNIKIEL